MSDILAILFLSRVALTDQTPEGVGEFLGRQIFQAAAANKIAAPDFSVNGLKRTIEFFGGTAKPLSVTA